MRQIELTKGLTALVDEEDFVRVSRHSWCAFDNGYGHIYAQSRINKRTVLLHRLVADAPVGLLVDHFNGNTLDCRRANLRLATRAENAQNAVRDRTRRYSAHRGVTFDKSRGKWLAQLKANGVKVLHSRFATEEEAVNAYRDAALKHHGAFCSRFAEASPC